MHLYFIFLPIFFLIGTIILTAFSTALLRVGKFQSHEYFEPKQSRTFFFRYALKLFKRGNWENLYFILSFSNHILLLLYASTAFYYGLHFVSSFQARTYVIFVTFFVILVSTVFSYLIRLITTIRPKFIMKGFAPICSIYLYLLLPITAPLLKLTKYFFDIGHMEEPLNNFSLVQRKVKEILNETHLDQYLDPHDQKLLTRFLLFRQKLVKEVMAPRVDVFSLSSDITIRDAVVQVLDEGYSRIPIYKDNLDEVLGFVLYKDLLEKYSSKNEEELNESIKSLIKPVIYSPENKKISYLLQEFKQKQIHIAIVVNEYGGTEGIITIEDILEELVGDIEDETDLDEEEYTKLSTGSWIVDGKMTLIDLEEKLGIEIPHSTDYDTIGGYIFHCAGTIPSKGWRVHHDNFELEVLESTERTIEKIQIIPSKTCFIPIPEKKQKRKSK